VSELDGSSRSLRGPMAAASCTLLQVSAAFQGDLLLPQLRVTASRDLWPSKRRAYQQHKTQSLCGVCRVCWVHLGTKEKACGPLPSQRVHPSQPARVWTSASARTVPAGCGCGCSAISASTKCSPQFLIAKKRPAVRYLQDRRSLTGAAHHRQHDELHSCGHVVAQVVSTAQDKNRRL
jgi:hypothetical protein